MRDPPDIVSRQGLDFYWVYKDEEGQEIALVARYRDFKDGTKKRFHQYRICNDGQWVEGAPTPLPLYGIDSLPKSHFEQKVYILEGEKCTTAAHHLGLSAITSMMGSGQAKDADWAILAKYRHVGEFILIPDNDEPGHKYIETVFKEIQKACPHSKVSVCQLPTKDKGDDLVEWIQSNISSPLKWNGFAPIEKPYTEHLRHSFLSYVHSNRIEANKYFEKASNTEMFFEYPPDPIQEALCPVLSCPLDTLPIEVISWIQGTAMQMQISEDYLVAPLFVYLGSLIGRKRGLRIRPGTGWIEYPNLWGMLVGRPAMMKSPAMNAALRPLIALADRAAKEYDHALVQYNTDLETWKIRKKASEEVYKKNFKDSLDNKSNDQPYNRISFYEEEKPQEPRKKRYKTQDATIEKLGELLIDNPQGLLLYRDELSGWLNSFEKTGRESDRQLFLESWSGKEDFDVDRICRGSLHIPALCLSIFGSIQPGPLTQYVRSAVQGGVGDDGFIQRFQIMVWPDPKDTWELVSGTSISDLELPIQAIFDCLDSLKFDLAGSPILLSFAEDAQEMFDQWQVDFEKKIRSGKLPAHLEAHLSKYKKMLPALCLILEHLKQAVGDLHPQVITIKTLEAALRWLDYFESHACRVYGSGANAVLKAANDLIKRLQQGDISEPFTARDVYCGKHWAGLATITQVEEVLEFLIEKHFLVCKTLRTGGRPTTKYWVNPKVFEENI